MGESSQPLFKCEFCSYRGSCADNMNVHNSNHYETETWQCNVCRKKFSSSGSLKMHMISHNTEQFDYELCHISFAQSNVGDICIRNDSDSETLQYEFLDEYCTKSQNNQMNIKKYTRHNRLKCDFCDDVFNVAHQKELHVMSIHNGERPFRCDICEMCFSRQQDRKRHMRIHTGEKPYKCDFCEKSFTQSNNKKRHMRIHSGDRPFKCEYCDDSFTQMQDKTRHMRIHTGEKPYKCDYCDKRFIQSQNRKKHMRIHTGEKPFKCDFCDKCFTQLEGKKAHMVRHKRKGINLGILL